MLLKDRLNCTFEIALRLKSFKIQQRHREACFDKIKLQLWKLEMVPQGFQRYHGYGTFSISLFVYADGVNNNKNIR